MSAEPISIVRPTAPEESRGVRRARMRLLCKMEQQSLWLAHHRADAASIGGGQSKDVRTLERARAALNAFRARAALEELEGALVRLDAGMYGSCARCGAPISVERLDATPEAVCCADCDLMVVRDER